MNAFFSSPPPALLPVGRIPVPGPTQWNGPDESDMVPAHRAGGGGDEQTGIDSLAVRRPRKLGSCRSVLRAFLGQQVGGKCWRQSGKEVKRGPLLSGR